MAEIDAVIAGIINTAIATADTYLGAADSATQNAITASLGYATPGNPLVGFSVTAVEPPVPAVADATLTYEAQLDKLVQLLSGQLASYYALYYPLLSDAYDEATAWLVNTITVGGTGLSPTIEDQIWQRGRTRILTEGSRVEAQALTEFAGRGYTLPPGVLAGRLQEARFEQLAKSSDFSAQVAIESAKIEIENIKFAVDLAIKTRISAMEAANNYIRSLMSAPDAAARMAGLNTDAQARMMQATADLYRARLSRDELILNSSNADQSARLAWNKMDVDAFYEGIKNRVAAATSAATAYGNSAAAALSQLSTVASSSQVAF